MKLPELNTPCSKAEAVEIVKQFRLYMDLLDSTSPWKLEPEELGQSNRFVSCPDEPICWIALGNGAVTACRLSILYQSRSNGRSELFLGNIMPDPSVKMNPLPRKMYRLIAEKFNVEIWEPFLQSIRYKQSNTK